MAFFPSCSFSGSGPLSLAVGIANFNCPIGFTSLPSSLLSSSFLRFFAACCCSLMGRFLGLLIFPVGGRRGRGNRCLVGRSSSSTRGLPWFAANLVAKKSWTKPICEGRLSVEIGS